MMSNNLTDPKIEKRKHYAEKRKHLMYYRYVDFLVAGFAHDCESLIDVGANKISITEKYNWIKRRCTLDHITPYQSDRVTGIRANFFEYEPEERFDFAICLQVLEHIPDVQNFAQKLFTIAERVLISVPFQWDPPAPSHVHDPVDCSKLRQWTGREPDYSIVVKEPLTSPNRSDRLICYYGKQGEKFRISQVKQRANEINSIYHIF